MIGFQINKRERCVSQELVSRFKLLPVANISDCMSRLTAGGASLRPMHNGAVLAGPALTVKTRPGDNLLVHKALELAAPGDVIVVDAGGDLTNAIIGELMVTYAQKKAVAGFIINGAIRDVDTLSKGSLPVFAAGVTHRGPYKDGPGEVNVAVSIGGMCIEPGDLILGDADGLLCIPFNQLNEVYEEAMAKQRLEEKTMADIAAGVLDTTWIDQRLRTLGCAGV